MAKRPRIAVVGSANIDLTTFTNQFPKPGETIFGQKFDLGFGGKGANQAVRARRQRSVRPRNHRELPQAGNRPYTCEAGRRTIERGGANLRRAERAESNSCCEGRERCVETSRCRR